MPRGLKITEEEWLRREAAVYEAICCLYREGEWPGVRIIPELLPPDMPASNNVVHQVYGRLQARGLIKVQGSGGSVMILPGMVRAEEGR